MTILADETTRILVQGITGREAATFVKDSLEYGGKVAAGVTRGKGGGAVHGVPVYDTVAAALAEHPAEATVISVPPGAVRDAALEALAAGLSLLVIVTERVPRRDVAEILGTAEDCGATVVGPNSLGILSPGKTKVGMVGGPAADVRKAYTPGPVVLCWEPGGTAEEDLAEAVRARGLPLPVVAFVAGRFADEIPGVRFGHAAAIVEGGRGGTRSKIAAFPGA